MLQAFGIVGKYAVLNLRNTRTTSPVFQITKSSYFNYSSAAVEYADIDKVAASHVKYLSCFPY